MGTETTLPNPRIGISACLLGQEVRYDGGHKRDAFLTEILGHFVEWVLVCPEVELGLGTPRPPIQLARQGDPPRHAEYRRRLYGRHPGLLPSGAWPSSRGWISMATSSKRISPSCGMAGVKVHHEPGAPSRDGRGLVAEVLMARLPRRKESRAALAAR